MCRCLLCRWAVFVLSCRRGFFAASGEVNVKTAMKVVRVGAQHQIHVLCFVEDQRCLFGESKRAFGLVCALKYDGTAYRSV